MNHPAAQPSHCPHCQHPVLNGPDNDHCAQPANADPTPLNAQGEAIAQLLGLATYLYDTDGRLWRRDQWQITGQPAGVQNPQTPGDVVAQHQCEISLDQYATNTQRKDKPKRQPQTQAGKPPY